MAFPSVRSSSSEANVVGSGGVSWTMPASITAGDLLIAVFYRNVTSGTFGDPSGWTADTNNPLENDGYLFFKVAAGSDTCSPSNTTTIGIAGTIMSVQDWSGTIATDVDVATSSVGSNPGSVTAGWGSDDNLYVEAVGANGGTLPSVSAWSTNYTEINKATGDYGTDVFTGTAYRQLAAASDDPDTITVTGSPGAASSWTIVIEPGGAATQPLTSAGTFTKAPTFPTGTISAGAFALTSAGTFTKAPTFPTGAISVGAIGITSAGTFTKAPTFPTGAISVGAIGITSAGTFTKAPTFPTGVVSIGAIGLTGTVYQLAPTFPTGVVTGGAVYRYREGSIVGSKREGGSSVTNREGSVK